VLLDCSQGSLEGREGSRTDTTQGLKSMAGQVDCELLGGCFRDRTRYAAEQEISSYDSPSSGGAAITSKLMPNFYAALLAGVAGKCTSSFKGRDQKVVSGASFPAWLATLP
jgi:hypothetical protein